MASDQTPGLIRRKSAHDAAETARRFRAAAKGAGLTIFAEIDHQERTPCPRSDMTLGPLVLLIFGNPRPGTGADASSNPTSRHRPAVHGPGVDRQRTGPGSAGTMRNGWPNVTGSGPPPSQW